MTSTTYDASASVTPGRDTPSLPGGQRSAPLPLFLGTLAVAVFIGVLTGSMITVLLPVIRDDFAASPAQAGWIVTGFSLAYAVGIPLYGKLSNLFGLRRLFACGLLAFALGGLICALAPSLVVLVVGRVVQGLGGAAVASLTPLAIARVLPPGARGGALGVTASSVGLGQVVGPIAGGTLAQVADWRWLFVGTLILALLIVPIVLWVMPATAPGGVRRIDLIGAALLALAASLVLLAVTQGQAAGFGAASSWGSLLAGGLATAAFAHRITHASDPFVSPRLFRNRVYLSASLVGFCAMFAYLSTIILVPWLLIDVHGLAPAAAGLLLTPSAAAIALLSPVSGRLSDRVGVRPLTVAGLATMGLAIFALSSLAGGSPLPVLLGMIGLGVGFSLLNSPLTNAAANALFADEIGEGLGLYQALYFLGGGIGAAVTAALLAARREASADALNPFVALEAAPFSDAFLVSVLALVAALVAARGLAKGDAAAD